MPAKTQVVADHSLGNVTWGVGESFLRNVIEVAAGLNVWVVEVDGGWQNAFLHCLGADLEIVGERRGEERRGEESGGKEGC